MPTTSIQPAITHTITHSVLSSSATYSVLSSSATYSVLSSSATQLNILFSHQHKLIHELYHPHHQLPIDLRLSRPIDIDQQ